MTIVRDTRTLTKAALATALLVVVLLIVASLVNAPAALAACPNETIRGQQKAEYLPECRGFELASPELKNGEDADYPLYLANPVELPYQAAFEGPGIAMDFLGGIPGSQSAGQFVQAVGRSGGPGSGWSSTVLAPNGEFGSILTQGPLTYGQVNYYSPSLSCAIQQSKLTQPNPEGGLLLPAGKTPEEEYGETPEEYVQNIFVVDTANATRTLVTTQRPQDPTKEVLIGNGAPYFIDGATADCRHVTFEEDAIKAGTFALPVAPGSSEFAPPKSLYAWSAGTTRTNGRVELVSVLPDGKPALGRVINKHGEENGDFHALSSDGKRAFFTALPDDGTPEQNNQLQVFMHEIGASTTQVSKSKTEVPDNGAKFYGASADGSKVFFAANYGLTERSSNGAEAPVACQSGSSAPGGIGCDLYEYQVAGGTLTDISADLEAETGDKTGANVRGVVGMSEDGSRVYFSTNGQLVPGGGQSGAANAEKHESNVYAYDAANPAHHGLSYVATISENEAGGANVNTTEPNNTMNTNTLHGNHYEAGRVSEDGEYLLLISRLPLTSYDNVDAASGIKDPEYYEYKYTTGPGSVTCVSCDPSKPKPEQLNGETPFGALGTLLETHQNSPLRNLLNDGRVFFDNYQLVPQAKTNMVHAYEWQPAGFEGCVPTTSFSAGCVHLLDGGNSTFPTYFEGASADGAHVYVTTTDPIAPQDPDGLRDVYDVRVGGGTFFVPPPPGCEENGHECQGVEGGELNLGIRASENAGKGNPPLPPRGGTGAVESFVTGKVAVTKHSHKGSTVTLVIKAPGKGKVTVSGSGVSTAGKSVGASGTYTLKLTLGKKARSAIKHHKKVKVKLRVAFKPSNGVASSANITVTV